MRPFTYAAATDASEAMRAAAGRGGPPTSAPAQYLAGGTTLIDLMKLDVMRPTALVDINGLARNHARIDAGRHGLRLGALARMADVAANPVVRRDYPVLAQSLELAASAQIRNMASLGGNALQRTRCTYFRDTRWTACNKRDPGSGCSAIGGVARELAVLGTSAHCIASYPGDWAVAMVALNASVDVLGAAGSRVIPFARLHRPPGDTPHIETTLSAGELITGFTVPAGPWTRRSLYLKIRDRESYQFALASAAVALHIENGIVAAARIGLGGLATVPWRSHEAEQALHGRPLDEASAREAAERALADAAPQPDNAFKVELGRRTLVRALLAASRMEA
jgi:xanthine dehydrogenase YagS FAD-binding subunit